MDIRNELLQDHSKENCSKIAGFIEDDPEQFDVLMNIFLKDDWRMTQRAAWVVSHCADQYPELIIPWIGPLVTNLENEVNDAVKRNTVRVLQFVEIPEEHMGKLTDICFNYLGSANVPIAVKVFSMTVLYNITLKIPELKNELLPLIEDLMPYGSPGFQSRGRKIIKSLANL